MHCEWCGKQISDGSKFCPYCGSPVDYSTAGKRKPSFLIVLILVLAIILLLLVGAYIVIANRIGTITVPFLDAIFSDEQGNEAGEVINLSDNSTDTLSNQGEARFSDVYPGVMLQKGMIPARIEHIDDLYFTEEHRPYVQFYDDMRCLFHANYGMWDIDIEGIYEVYVYNEGNRIISCVFDFDSLTEIGEQSYASNRVFFRELSQNEWEYCGELVGMTYNAARLVAVDDSTVNVDQCVLDESVYLDYIGYWQHFYPDEAFPDAQVVIADVSKGRIIFDVYSYRAFDFFSETAVICPDGNAYGFISRDSDNPQSFTTLTFGDTYISAELRHPEGSSGGVGGSLFLDTRSDTSAFYQY